MKADQRVDHVVDQLIERQRLDLGPEYGLCRTQSLYKSIGQRFGDRVLIREELVQGAWRHARTRGNGFLLVEAAKHLTTGMATGIDVWKAEAGEQTAELAWRNAQLEGVADLVEIKNVDARAMPFDDNTFDVIVSSLMLHHAGDGSDRYRVLQEMARVLKPEGTILLYDVSPLIANAARQLKANGVTSIERSGRLMARLSARRSSAA